MHGLPTDKIRHVGDLGNIEADDIGNAKFTIEDSQISLYGRQDIMGRAVEYTKTQRCYDQVMMPI